MKPAFSLISFTYQYICLGIIVIIVELFLQRSEMTDFDRFKLRKAKQIRNRIRSAVYYKLKKKATKEGTLYTKKKSKAPGKEKKPKAKPKASPKK